MPPLETTQKPVLERERTYRGTVKWFRDDLSYGYIRPDFVCSCANHASGRHDPCVHCDHQHPEDVFVLYLNIFGPEGKRKTLLAGQWVEFSMGPSRKYRDQAVDVRVVQG